LKNLLLITFFILIQACSTTKPNNYVMVEKDKTGHVDKIEYNGLCALQVAQGNFKNAGKDMFQVKKDDKTYYFGSEAAKNKFLSNYEVMRNKADANWEKLGDLGGIGGDRF